MGLFSSVSKIVDKVSDTIGFTNTTTGIAKLIQDETGMSPSQQYATGATVGFLNMLGGKVSSGDNDDNNNGILGAIFGSGENSLSGILGSVVKGAVGIGSDYFSNQQYYKDQTRLNEQKFGFDRQLADEAYQRDVAMWKMQNAYNTPAQQMQRLKQAGLNPNLVYGSGNVTGNTAGSPPSYPQVSYPDSKAQKVDLARNVLGIFNEYQSIKNQALANQRENARVALQRDALEFQKEREANREKEAERRFNVLLANLDLRRQQANQPPATVRNLNGIEKYASDKSEQLFDWLIPIVDKWWNRPLKDDKSIPELF